MSWEAYTVPKVSVGSSPSGSSKPHQQQRRQAQGKKLQRDRLHEPFNC